MPPNATDSRRLPKEQRRDQLVVIPANINILATGLCIDSGGDEYLLNRPEVAEKCLSLPSARFEPKVFQTKMMQNLLNILLR